MKQSTEGRRLFRRSSPARPARAMKRNEPSPVNPPESVEVVELPENIKVPPAEVPPAEVTPVTDTPPPVPEIRFDVEEDWTQTPEPVGSAIPAYGFFAQPVEDVKLPEPELELEPEPEPEPEPMSLEDAIMAQLTSGTLTEGASLSKATLTGFLSDHDRLKGLDTDKAQAVMYRTLNKLKADGKVERVGSPKDATWKATEL